MKLLVLEDDLNVAQGMSKLLTVVYGFEVVLSHTIQEATDALGKQEYDRIVSDVCLQGETGLDFYNWLTENRPEMVDKMAFHTAGAPWPLQQAVEATGVPVIRKGDIEGLVRQVGGSDR